MLFDSSRYGAVLHRVDTIRFLPRPHRPFVEVGGLHYRGSEHCGVHICPNLIGALERLRLTEQTPDPFPCQLLVKLTCFALGFFYSSLELSFGRSFPLNDPLSVSDQAIDSGLRR